MLSCPVLDDNNWILQKLLDPWKPPKLSVYSRDEACNDVGDFLVPLRTRDSGRDR